MSHDDDLPNHCPLCTHSCFPWFQCWRPRIQVSPKMEEGSLRWKNRAEPAQGSCRHKKWSRRLRSYHLKILDIGDFYPSRLGVIGKNIHTVATKSSGFCFGKAIEDRRKIRSTQEQLCTLHETPSSGLMSLKPQEKIAEKRNEQSRKLDFFPELNLSIPPKLN